MKPIMKKNMPFNKQATYARWVADIRVQKEQQHWVRMTTGGN